MFELIFMSFCGICLSFGFYIFIQSTLALYALRHCLKVNDKAGEFIENKWDAWYRVTNKNLYPIDYIQGKASYKQSNEVIDTVWPDCPADTRKWANRYHCMSYKHPVRWVFLDPKRD